MKGYFLCRIGWMLLIVFLVSTAVFFMIHLIPGDPIDQILGENALPGKREELRQALNLHLPLYQQYWLYWKHLITLDLGTSIHTQEKVWDIIKAKYPQTILLSFTSLGLAILISIPLGIVAALKQNKSLDNISMVIALLGISLPNFWLGPILILIFSINLNWLPPSGNYGWQSLILPSFSLGTALAAILTRLTRASMLDVLREDYILAARAKGLPEYQIILKHALKNALIPIITILGLQAGSLLGGAVIVEEVFAWPGIGREVVTAIRTRDFPLVQGCILIIATTYLTVNILTDLAYALVNPKIRYD